MAYIVLTIILILIVTILVIYNNLIKLNNFVKEAFSTMDIYLKKRWDLIPNLVETVKGYSNYENDLLEKITEIRSNNYQEMEMNKKFTTNEVLNLEIPKLMAIAEKYPELKASQNFLKLSDELSKIEDEIANSRKYYNGTVRIYNTKIQMFPNNLVANIFEFKEANMFVADTNEKSNVKVDL